jgi:hypothetical protein
LDDLVNVCAAVIRVLPLHPAVSEVANLRASLPAAHAPFVPPHTQSLQNAVLCLLPTQVFVLQQHQMSHVPQAPAVDMSMLIDRHESYSAPNVRMMTMLTVISILLTALPQSLVKLADGTRRVVHLNCDAVVPMVYLPSSADTTFIFRTETPLSQNTSSSDTVSTLVTLSVWYSIYMKGKWAFPSHIFARCPVYMTCVCNVVFDSGHVRTPTHFSICLANAFLT